jgi:hypothetical protein
MWLPSHMNKQISNFLPLSDWALVGDYLLIDKQRYVIVIFGHDVLCLFEDSHATSP